MFLALRVNSVVELETLLLLRQHKHQLTLFILCHFLQMGLLNKYFMDASLLGLSLQYRSSHFASKMLMMIFLGECGKCIQIQREIKKKKKTATAILYRLPRINRLIVYHA